MKNDKQLEVADFIVSTKQMSLDMVMVPYDLWGTIVHVLMLHKQKILSVTDIKVVLLALQEIKKEVSEHKFIIDPNKGAQLSLEAKIIEKVGAIGYSIHTGRSRNDQVMVTEMLYLKEQILIVVQKLIVVQQILFALAQDNINTVMPGYTHMQPAKPTTFGQWSLAYFYSFTKTLDTIKFYYELYDLCPLGACESYGTSWPINRKYTASLLGFSKPWEIPQDAISSRGFPQLGYLTALSEIGLVASKLAQDLLLFSTFEFKLISLGDEVAQRMHPITGSSVMAQKKNPDVLELIRSTAPQVSGFLMIVHNILSGLPMGYNRDTREVKEYIGLGLSKTLTMVGALEKVLNTICINRKRMEKSVMANYSLTTDLADYISQRNKIGYRLIYKIVGQVVGKAINSGKLLADVTANELIIQAKESRIDLKITDQELKQLMNPKVILSKRQHIGGSGLKSMNKTMKRATNDIDRTTLWLADKQKTVFFAKKKTEDLVSKLTNS